MPCSQHISSLHSVHLPLLLCTPACCRRWAAPIVLRTDAALGVLHALEGCLLLVRLVVEGPSVSALVALAGGQLGRRLAWLAINQGVLLGAWQACRLRTARFAPCIGFLKSVSPRCPALCRSLSCHGGSGAARLAPLRLVGRPPHPSSGGRAPAGGTAGGSPVGICHAHARAGRRRRGRAAGADGGQRRRRSLLAALQVSKMRTRNRTEPWHGTLGRAGRSMGVSAWQLHLHFPEAPPVPLHIPAGSPCPSRSTCPCTCSASGSSQPAPRWHTCAPPAAPAPAPAPLRRPSRSSSCPNWSVVSCLPHFWPITARRAGAAASCVPATAPPPSCGGRRCRPPRRPHQQRRRRASRWQHRKRKLADFQRAPAQQFVHQGPRCCTMAAGNEHFSSSWWPSVCHRCNSLFSFLFSLFPLRNVSTRFAITNNE